VNRQCLLGWLKGDIDNNYKYTIGLFVIISPIAIEPLYYPLKPLYTASAGAFPQPNAAIL